MKNRYFKTALAVAVIGAVTAAVPAHAVQVAFSGGSNTGNLETVVGDDGINNVWQTHNGEYLLYSNFAMSDFRSTPQPFNAGGFSNGLGTFATSFQITVNNSPLGAGFRGISLDGVGSGMSNHLIVIGDFGDESTWTSWDITYDLLDLDSGLFQQVLFTAPYGSRLAQGVDFSLNVNFAGLMSDHSGWAASFDDRISISAVPIPASMGVFSLGLLGLGAFARRHRA